MRHRLAYLGPALIVALLAFGSPGSAQERRDMVLGVWRVALQAPTPRMVVAISVCHAQITQAWDGWVFTLVRDHGHLTAVISSQRFRPQARRQETLPGTIGEAPIRLLVEREMEPGPGRSGWGMILRVLDEPGFRAALQRGGRLRIETPDGDMDWPTDASDAMLAALAQCTWLDPPTPN